MTPDDVRKYLEFYRDLGVKDVYRVPAAAAAAVTAPDPAPAPAVIAGPLPQPSASTVKLPPVLPGLAPENDTLEKILEDIGDCRRCRLGTTRNKLVFGTGNG